MTRDPSKKLGRKTGGPLSRTPPRAPGSRQAAEGKAWSPRKESEQQGRRRSDPQRDQAQASGPTFRRPTADLVALFGFHAVREALRANRRQLLDIYATKAAADRLSEEIASTGLRPHIVEAEDLARRLGANAVHQGVMLEARRQEPVDLSDIPSRSGVVLVLDQITDPHNVGAILRTAAAFGVDALVMTERHAPEMAGVVAKAASGGLEHVAIVSVVNLARALEQLGDMGYLRIGLDSEAPVAFAEAGLTRPLALVLGGEGKGLRRLTKENCDILARLDMPGAIKSLNVSNACAVALTLAHAGAAR
ncbi:23S rRNA (guanosine(2251)-2'-O)-methyltransferase RlmB [Methylocapsa polymorpha]|uniref:23S rRNA (Guanosine(2251)-2'-O)-methyltransferase RlmB n=1 Tax=Methylocapsa polymorpha TaxID=3080828 RepID=A0ABZ0HR13_9HYPH|nr:23S rRNA (guanosine(2251)-2'-O)-methyltransferase RlmB [Methylocapsa sp. RX1]